MLYWFVSQVWAIGQQYFTNWLVPRRAGQAAGGRGAARQERGAASLTGLIAGPPGGRTESTSEREPDESDRELRPARGRRHGRRR